MNVAFHSNQLNMRGTEVALYDYALYNEEILGNKSSIISNAQAELSSLDKFEKRFEVFLYDEFKESIKFVEQRKVDSVYFIKAGQVDHKVIPGVQNCIHAVFQYKEKHGEKWAYVSDWLAETMGMPGEYVPHVVKMPMPVRDYRDKLNIPRSALVIGRYGGINDFDLPIAMQAVYTAVQQRSDLFFVFMNTRPFCNHEQVKFVEGTYNMQHKSDFINTCDYMIHARNHGESFGLAICEFLFHNKPVITYNGGWDQHHIKLMGDRGIYYSSAMDLITILLNIKRGERADVFDLVQKFAPKPVMKIFQDKFLS